MGQSKRTLRARIQQSQFYPHICFTRSSVMAYCLWPTYRFPAVLYSRLNFRLSVRQVVFRVILRSNAFHYFTLYPIWAHHCFDICCHKFISFSFDRCILSRFSRKRIGSLPCGKLPSLKFIFIAAVQHTARLDRFPYYSISRIYR